MTDVNKHNPYPEIATIRCPRCGNATEFRRAVSLTNGKSWAWWQPRLWPCAAATDWTAKERWAPGNPQPGWRGWIVIEHDPSLYRWKQPTHGYTANDDGVVSCIICVGRRKHVLDWPSDAYYRFDLPQGSLWAWSREGAEALIEFIASTKRDCGAHGPHYLFLRHIPSAFLGAKDRQAIVSRLRRELSKLRP